MDIKRNALLALMGLVLATTAVSGASAETLHPRRAEVNERAAHQMHRIREARRDGEIGARKAARLEKAEYRVHMQERGFAHRHHGRITRAEQRRLNHEENHVGRRIPS
jgi:hypothetical protein